MLSVIAIIALKDCKPVVFMAYISQSFYFQKNSRKGPAGPFYINPNDFKIVNQNVILKALNNVVNMTTLDVKTPLCPILFAITNADTVVLDPAMIKIATKA